MTLPPPDWYDDPGDASAKRYWDGTRWTDWTRPASETPSAPAPGGAVAPADPSAPTAASPFGTGAPPPPMAQEPAPKSRKGLVIGLSIGGAVVVLGIIAIAIGALYLGKVKSHDHTIDEMVAPDGWMVKYSDTNSYAFAYDPAWTDLNTPQLAAQYRESLGNHVNYTYDFAGIWQVSASASGGSVLQMIGGTYRVTSVDLEQEMKLVAKGASAGFGNAPTTTLRDDTLTNPLGYESRLEEFSVSSNGKNLYMGVAAVAEGDTIIFAIMVSSYKPPTWEGTLTDVASSIVIVNGI